MKLRIPIVSLLIIVTGLCCRAQSLDALIDNTNRLKMQYGECDDRYLGALDTLVKTAYSLEYFEIAHKYRSIHSDIIEKKYGSASLEYAEDIWRMGNISLYMGEDYVISCYEKCLEIYNSINALNEFPYCHIIGVLSSYYCNKNDFPSAIKYQNEYVSKSKNWINYEWKGNSISIIEYAHAYLFLGTLNYWIQNFESAANAINQCVSIIKENNLQTVYEESVLAYGLLAHCYRLMKDAFKTAFYQEQYIDLLEQVEGDMSDKYLNELSSLRFDYWSLKDLNSIKRCSEKLLLKVENKCQSMNTLPYNDSLYISTINDLISFCNIFMDDNAVIEYSEQALGLLKDSNNIKPDVYVNIYDALIAAYHRKREYLKESALFDTFENLISVQNNDKSEEYCYYLVEKAECLFALGKYDESKAAYDEVKELALSIFGKNSQQYLIAILSEAANAANQEMNETCRHNIQECYSIIESDKDLLNRETFNLIMCHIHRLEGKMYVSGSPTLAEEKLTTALEEAKILNIPTYTLLTDLGLLYYNHYRDFKKAISYFQEARSELEQYGDNHSVDYLAVLNNIALCAMELGQSSVAITVFDIIGRELKNNYGEIHPLHMVSEQNKTKFYQTIQDYDKAIVSCKAAIEQCAHLYGENSAKYALCLQNYGMLLQYKNELTESENLLIKAIQILELLNTPDVIMAYSNLLSAYLIEQKFEEAEIVFNTAREKLSNLKLEGTNVEIDLCGAIGYGLAINQVPNSKQYFGRIIDIMEKNGTSSGTSHLKAVIYYILTSFYDNTQSGRMISPFLSEYKKTFSDDIRYLNEDERESFITGSLTSQTKNILFSLHDDDSQNTDLYNFLLFNKGLLLETSRGFAKAVRKSKDVELISKYERYTALKHFLNGEAIDLTPLVSLDEATFEISTLEREITLNLRQQSDYQNSEFSFDDVRDSLNEKELAIEFVSYSNLLDNEEYYAAMLASSKYETPIFIRLCKKKDLESYINLSPDRLYGEDIVSENMYNLIWKPISNYLIGITTVYFAPAGYLNTISIENLYNGKDHISDILKICRMSSTRELCKEYGTTKHSSAVLYGGLTYDEDDDVMLKASRSIRKSMNGTCLFNETGSITRKGWNYLPGTREEVDIIQSILAKSNISSISLTEWKGSEESFKSLSGENTSILHIATHGFFLDEAQSKKSEFFIRNPFDNRTQIKEISPLKRSGLLLSGGNRAWKGEEIPAGIEDGVLTAEEIALLDFSLCDIVVLSACETGLGDVTDEGVYGLQRAFKNAGVQTIVMSLWEVDDQATSLMMRTFYSNLAKGMAKYDAFKSAQRKVRTEYKEPRYWAAFIMLD